MSEDMKSPVPPKGLQPRGRKLWKELHARYEFDPHEAEAVLEVCRTLDVIDLLAGAIQRDGAMIMGSQGQMVLNSAVAELRQQRASYARLVAQLNLDGAESGEGMKSPRSASASATAKRRWAGHDA